VAESFFDEQTEQSLVKAEIVSKYFWAYMKVIMAAQKNYGKENRVAYIDLFAGPGRYADGSKSTPVKIVEKAIAEPDFRERLVALFNDKDEQNTKDLEGALKSLPGYSTLKHEPQIYTGEVGEDMVRKFEEMKLIPTFFFVDPFGYKGLSLRLVNSVLKNWGCDCVFFFNYNRINMGLGNDLVEEHMNALFGRERADRLRERFNMQATPAERELYMVEELVKALKEMGGRYVLPFRFCNSRGTRTTHHLIFVTKHFRGYSIMKDIMAGQSSSKEQGVPTLEYNPADARYPSLFELFRPLDDLEGMLLERYAGKTLNIKQIFEDHSVGRRYVLSNYREILCRMEQEGKVKMSRPCPPRKKGTLAEDVKITFPQRG
jgi:three-Cys-motif partner protein